MSAKKVVKNICKGISIVGGLAATGFGVYTLVTGGNKTVGIACTAGGGVVAASGLGVTVAGAVKHSKKKEEATEEVIEAADAEVVDEDADKADQK